MSRPLRERRPHDAHGPSYLAAFLELRAREQRRAAAQPTSFFRSLLVSRQEARAVGSSPRPAARAAVSGGAR